jgi:cellulose synthase/poly-beta-1,6-N-acetylglucosamine synthase-like glycosyltransferase
MLFTLLTLLYTLLLGLLFIYGLNILYLSWISWRERHSVLIPPPMADFASVTVQIALYNERYVAQRLIEAVCSLEWPKEKLEIQVLDDSDDDTLGLVAGLVQHYQKLRLTIQHLHRTHRQGYKAGALAAGMTTSQGDYIAIFDADFVPEPDFLLKTMPYFADPKIGFVQTRWGHLNRAYSWLTQLQAIGIDAHFTVEQFARHRAAFLMNFNGTAGIWRKTAIEAAGGWQSTTLTEDLDLSYRAQLAGWQACYQCDIVTPAEIPVTLKAFRRQQYRWARGSIECAKTLIPQVLAHPFPWRVKGQACLHLTGYGIQVLMSLVALCYPFVIQSMQQNPTMHWLFDLTALFTLTFLAPTLYFLLGQQAAGRRWYQTLPWVLLLNVFGAGMMYHSAYAVFQGLFSRQAAAFERTPKFGITASQDSWQAKAYQMHWDWLNVLELGMLLYNLNTLRLAVQSGYYSIAFYAALFAVGGLLMLGMMLWQELQQMWPHLHQRRQTQATIEG